MVSLELDVEAIHRGHYPLFDEPGDERLPPFGGHHFQHQVALVGLGQQLLEMIEEMLDLSRLESTELSLDETEFDVSVFVAETAQKIEPILHAKRQKLQIFGDVDGCWIRADRNRLDQVLDREEALLALTRWPARFIGASDSLGSIEPGKLADLVVFDGNIMDVSIENLSELKPVLTLVGGKIAYESASL